MSHAYKQSKWGVILINKFLVQTCKFYQIDDLLVKLFQLRCRGLCKSNQIDSPS